MLWSRILSSPSRSILSIYTLSCLYVFKTTITKRWTSVQIMHRIALLVQGIFAEGLFSFIDAEAYSHAGFSPHCLIAGIEWNDSSIWPDNYILTFTLYPFIESSFLHVSVIGVWWFFFGLVITFLAWTFLAFMYWSTVSNEIQLWSSLKITFTACNVRWCWIRSHFEVARRSH